MVKIPLCVLSGGGVHETLISVADTDSAEMVAGLAPGAAINRNLNYLLNAIYSN